MNPQEKAFPIKICAFQIADSIHLKDLKADFTGKLIGGSATELFYHLENQAYMYVFNYGVVAFANMPDLEMSKTISYLHQYSSKVNDNKMDEQYSITLLEDENLHFGFDSMFVPEINEEVIKIGLLNIAQSVALDFYAKETDDLLEKVKKFTNDLEQNGKLTISKKNMLRFIGRSLNTKNRILENLYIFDSPDVVWDNGYLDKIYTGLSKVFELRNRYKEIESTLRNIEANLNIFMQINQHGEAKMLEWIIIWLIVIEVLHMFIKW
jgi:required for meiotic nuclear division protein 1